MGAGIRGEKKEMKCQICKRGETKPGKITVTLERGVSTVIFKHVPARVCENCGEEYVDDKITKGLLKTADQAVGSGVQVDIREYIAA